MELRKILQGRREGSTLTLCEINEILNIIAVNMDSLFKYRDLPILFSCAAIGLSLISFVYTWYLNNQIYELNIELLELKSSAQSVSPTLPVKQLVFPSYNP